MRAKRTDKSQAAIVNKLRDAHIQTIVTNMGDDFPDLICAYMGSWTLVEVKEMDGGSLSRGQLEFFAGAWGRCAVVTDFDSAYKAITTGQGLVTPKQQERIFAWLQKNPTQESVRIKKFMALIQGSPGS